MQPKRKRNKNGLKLRGDKPIKLEWYYILYHSTVRKPYLLCKAFKTKERLKRYIDKMGHSKKQYEIITGHEAEFYQKKYGIRRVRDNGSQYVSGYDYPERCKTAQQKKNYRNLVNKYSRVSKAKKRNLNKPHMAILQELLKKFRYEQKAKKKVSKGSKKPKPRKANRSRQMD